MEHDVRRNRNAYFSEFDSRGRRWGVCFGRIGQLRRPVVQDRRLRQHSLAEDLQLVDLSDHVYGIFGRKNLGRGVYSRRIGLAGYRKRLLPDQDRQGRQSVTRGVYMPLWVSVGISISWPTPSSSLSTSQPPCSSDSSLDLPPRIGPR